MQRVNPAHDFAAHIIARLGMSPVDRLIFGTAMVCDAVASINETRANSPFKSITVNEEEPFKTAIAALSVMDNLPEEAAPSPAVETGA